MPMTYLTILGLLLGCWCLVRFQIELSYREFRKRLTLGGELDTTHSTRPCGT